MAKKFLTAIDLSKNELQNAVIQNIAGPPSSPLKGQLYFDSGPNILYWYNGAAWVAAQDAGASTIYNQVLRDGGTAMTQRNAINFIDSASILMTLTDDAAGGETEVQGTVIAGSVTAMTSFGMALNNGTAFTMARSDHNHGTPTHDAAAHSTIPLSALAAATALINMGGFKITGVGAPTGASEAATKQYVDDLVSGLSWKDSVRAATTAAGTLASSFANGSVIDGVTLATGNRILIKNQAAGAENGIYTVNASGAPTRATDADAAAEIEGMAIFVSEGTTLADTSWVCTTNAPITVGTTALAFSQFGGGNLTQATADTLYVNVTGDTMSGALTLPAANPSAAAQAAHKGYVDQEVLTRAVCLTQACTANATQAVTYSGTTRNVVVAVHRSTTPWDEVECDIEHTSPGSITVRFATAPAAGEYNITLFYCVNA